MPYNNPSPDLLKQLLQSKQSDQDTPNRLDCVGYRANIGLHLGLLVPFDEDLVVIIQICPSDIYHNPTAVVLIPVVLVCYIVGRTRLLDLALGCRELISCRNK